MSFVLRGVALSLLILGSAPAAAQAPSRPCSSSGSGNEVPGPACLIAKVQVGNLPSQPVYWHLYTYPSAAAAQAEPSSQGSRVEAFGKIWLFTIADQDWHPKTGLLVARIGPLPLKPAASFTAEYLRSVFVPGMQAPLHIHSGPEAFFAVSGDTCLETPSGVQTAQGPGNSLVIEGGPPMLFMATGNELRRGFALILHDSALPPTSLVDEWHPKGLCKAPDRR